MCAQSKLMYQLTSGCVIDERCPKARQRSGSLISSWGQISHTCAGLGGFDVRITLGEFEAKYIHLYGRMKAG